MKVKIQWNKFKEKNRSTKDSMSHKIKKKKKGKINAFKKTKTEIIRSQTCYKNKGLRKSCKVKENNTGWPRGRKEEDCKQVMLKVNMRLCRRVLCVNSLDCDKSFSRIDLMLGHLFNWKGLKWNKICPRPR